MESLNQILIYKITKLRRYALKLGLEGYPERRPPNSHAQYITLPEKNPTKLEKNFFIFSFFFFFSFCFFWGGMITHEHDKARERGRAGESDMRGAV